MRTIVALSVMASALVLLGCDRSGPISHPRLVVLYATCSFNHSYTSPYNDSIPFTPNLARFARSSTVFTKHVTESGQSGTSYAALFSGTHAYDHGVYAHPTKLPEDLLLVSEAYADAGYETFFFNGHRMASSGLAYGQGVRPENTTARPLLKPSQLLFQKVLARLREDPDYRAFVVTNFTETHGPYKTSQMLKFGKQYPEQVAGVPGFHKALRYHALYVRNRHQLQFNFAETVERLGLSDAEVSGLASSLEFIYKSRISLVDYLFGGLVDALREARLLGSTLLVFTADHGETLYREHSHVKWEHGLALSPDVIGVPLIVHAPALDGATRRWTGVTRSIDVFPTMLGLSGIAVPPGAEGIDLTPALLGHAEAPELLAYSHTTMPVKLVSEYRKGWPVINKLFPLIGPEQMWTSVRSGDVFYRWRRDEDGTSRFEAFDLSSDPHATQDIFDESNPLHQKRAKGLREYKAQLVANFETDPSRSPSDTEAKEKLRSLGYIE